MKKVIEGNHAVSYGARLSRAEVIAAYPITPQTQVVELLSQMCADKSLDATFIKVESEHSSMACCIGASSTGSRAFTATSSQGLALMHELLHWAAGARLPIVMANVNRAVGPGWNIWTDQLDSLSQRDTGWLQSYCETNQEVLDTVLISYKIAEKILLPCMMVYDAFVLSHTSEIVEIPTQEQADSYLKPLNAKFRIDTENPRAFGGLTSPEHFMEFRYKMQVAMDESFKIADDAFKEFEDIFGRKYKHVEGYRTDDADEILVTSGATVSTARVVIDSLREKGRKVGLFKVRTFRPFPTDLIRKSLMGRKRIMVLDRNLSVGCGGIFAQEIKAAMNNVNNSPKILSFIAGLGGRDLTLDIISQTFEKAEAMEAEGVELAWLGLKQ